MEKRVGLEVLENSTKTNCLKKKYTEHNEPFVPFTFSLGLWLESELQGEIGSLTEPVASQREDGLQQRQAGLEVGSDSFLHNAGQSERGGKHSGRCTRCGTSRRAFFPHSHAEMVLDEVVHEQIVAQLGEIHGRVLVFGEDVAVGAVLQQEAHHVCVSPLARLWARKRREKRCGDSCVARN